MNAPAPLLVVSHLSKTFYDFWHRPVTKAVHDLSFTVSAGEIFGLLGANGAGKSTTIRSIMGLQHPSEGSVTVFGLSPDHVEVRRRIGYMPEESYLPDHLTCEETLYWLGALNEIPRPIICRRSTELLTMLQMTEARKKRVSQCSKGMQRRICLAQALLHNPDLLILDEPTSGLDPVACRQIKNLLSFLAQNGKTILLCSHILADVQHIADRIAIMQRGHMLVQGHVSELLQDSSSLEDYFIEMLRKERGAECSATAPLLFPPPAAFLHTPELRNFMS